MKSFVFLVLSCAIAVHAHSQIPSDLEVKLQLVDTLIKHNKFDRAVDILVDEKIRWRRNARGQAKILLKLGLVYRMLDDHVSSNKHFTNALLIPNGLDEDGQIYAYNLIAVNQMDFDDYDKSLINFRQAIQLIPKAIKKSGKEYEWIYNNIAITFVELGELDSAEHYHMKCLSIREKKGSELDLGQTYNNLGSLAIARNNFDTALYYFELGKSYRTKAPNHTNSSIIESDINIGLAYFKKGRFDISEQILMKQLSISEQEKNGALIKRSLEYLILLYEKTNRFKTAFDYLKAYNRINDSLFNEDKREELIRINESKKYFEKMMLDSLSYVEKERARFLEKQKEKQIQIQKEKTNVFLLTGAVIIIVLLSSLSVTIYRNLRHNKHISSLIIEQKEEVESQKNELTVINREITENISYAKRIQHAILPSKQSLTRTLNNYSLFYLPKAIVAGDFYWVREKHNKLFFAVGDCTGHGVSGALVSVVCSNSLNQSLEIHNKLNPADLLDQTNLLVVDALANNNDIIRDGMDIALCSLDRSKGQLEYSGANNGLYIIKRNKDVQQLIEYKGTRQHIGYSDKRRPFEQINLSVAPRDLIILFSDGFADQFGGPNGKKYKYNRFKDFLASIAHHEFHELESKIHDEFNRWKGKEEQVDDICILIVRV